MTVSLCMIAGGSDPLDDGLIHAIRSARPYVDEVCVWANGPRSDEVAKALRAEGERSGAPIVVECGEWADDYAAARNASYAMASSDWIICLDCNDELRGAENLRGVIAAAGERSTTIYVAYEATGWIWWPRVVRRGSGRWRGIVDEKWQRGDGSPFWLGGVGSPASAYAHPARLHVWHLDRDNLEKYLWKYVPILERAILDLDATPWAWLKLGDTLQGPRRKIDIFEQALADGWTEFEGAPNGWRLVALGRLYGLYEAVGRKADAARCHAEWEAYARVFLNHLGTNAAFRMSLESDDFAMAATWAAMPPESVGLLLDDNVTGRASAVAAKVGRNDPCWCGSGKKYKKCHSA